MCFTLLPIFFAKVGKTSTKSDPVSNIFRPSLVFHTSPQHCVPKSSSGAKEHGIFVFKICVTLSKFIYFSKMWGIITVTIS